ncbi:hypothetical protein [Sutcliffiella rhizosphaerae]|uniref:Uncharacterized protein n=1 Tax=Sutcliffiella rhizosphaerae TaxID=2880967 RepID=A0ABN8AAD0_9BACI|nr:hypothetical protein [Sutcliffiella rhizosphaerae]CAG9622153.1 hypothetical protein BACCIP111883_02944 [Sutcliffiella rhizosphaerae]
MTYSPNIDEAHIPYDGGWTEDKGLTVLLLSIPTLPIDTNTKIVSFSYTWLFEKEMNAYVLCIQLNKDDEFGILFSQGEAGQLLLDADAYGEFTLAIFKETLEEITDNTPYLSFPKIILNRNIQAGW